MASNSRLAIAVHTAGILAISGSEPVTSEAVAKSAGTNAVVVRRIIGSLVRQGIVAVRKGTGGGAYLTRKPEDISLADIYEALGEDTLFAVPDLGPEHGCPVGRIVRPVLEEYFGAAECAMTGHLAGISLRDVIENVRARITGADCGKTTNEQA